jgi:hypothetical protein
MITHELVLTTQAFTEMIRRVSSPDRGPEPLSCAVSRLPDRWEWLVSDNRAPKLDSSVVVLARGTHPETLPEAVRLAAPSHQERTCVVLGVGIGPAAGHFAGLIHAPGGIAELGAVRVVAPGLPRLSLGLAGAHAPPRQPPADRARFSRTIGVLGEDAFNRLRSLRFAVIGCGRTGSLVIDHLAACGVAGLTLIDPDVMEPHNLGEMAGELGEAMQRPKTTVLEEHVLRRGLGTAVKSVTGPVQSFEALFALKHADIFISCPDNAAARTATACVAALYLKPVLDLGTGALRGQTGREMGLDVRWLLPGRCVSCLGGARGETSEPHRLGSLRSLNTWAVGLGLTVLEQFMSGVVTGPLWVQGNVEADGAPCSTRVKLPPGWGCRICAVTGHGDDGLRHLDTIVRETQV